MVATVFWYVCSSAANWASAAARHWVPAEVCGDGHILALVLVVTR